MKDMMRDKVAKISTKLASRDEIGVRSKVESTCDDGYITRGMRDWAIALCTAAAAFLGNEAAARRLKFFRASASACPTGAGMSLES